MDYQATLDYLYGLTDYEQERITRYDPETLDLSRVRRVLARLQDPHQHYPTIHIAGTKGKGSVAAMCASALKAAGLRTGLYTSPHLHTFRERIQVNGELIPPDAVTSLVQRYRPIFDQEPELTTFEAVTVLALVYFDQQQVDFAVIEVGLGGRLDATNVITPQVAVITSLSFDHTYLLGNTLADIAYEKAGIIKPGVPTVCEPQAPEALAVIQRICAERRSPLTLVGRDWTWRMTETSLENQSFTLRHSYNTSALNGSYTLALLGRHQVDNAVTAIAALRLLQQDGLPLLPQHIHEGLASVRWPGRFEVLRRQPPLVVDCAHNGDSFAKLVAALEEYFGSDQRWTFVLGASSGKDMSAMLHAIAPWANRVLATRSRHARAMSPDQIVALTKEILPTVEIESVGDVGSALTMALKGGGPVCITGSIFVVADAQEAWARSTGGALPEMDHSIDH